MKRCYLCGIDSKIEEKSDGFLVQCPGPCGPYIITQKALSDLTKIHGRKQGTIDRVNALRQRDTEGLIRISHNAVAFVR